MMRVTKVKVEVTFDNGAIVVFTTVEFIHES
jgi:hypothetical protein